MLPDYRKEAALRHKVAADLIVLPILDIYRRYYGGRVALYILAKFYVTTAFAGSVVESVFGAWGLYPPTDPFPPSAKDLCGLTPRFSTSCSS
jgi:hypothetical protein